MNKHSIMEDHPSLSLSLPLLSVADDSASVSAAAATPTSQNESFFLSNYSIAFRFLSIIFIGIISLWANHEASKGFDITIVNDAKDSPAGQRFDLFYVSNEKATRMILNATRFVQTVIHPSDSNADDFIKKKIKTVHLKLSHRNLSQIVSVEKLENGSEFFIILSPSIFNERINVDHDMSAAILRGMSWIWLSDGNSKSPAPLIAGLVEYINVAAGFGKFEYYGEVKLPECDVIWWLDEDPKVVAFFLDYLEKCRKGFIQRLYRGLKSTWHDRTVEDALGVPGQRVCGPINSTGIRV